MESHSPTSSTIQINYPHTGHLDYIPQITSNNPGNLRALLLTCKDIERKLVILVNFLRKNIEIFFEDNKIRTISKFPYSTGINESGSCAHLKTTWSLCRISHRFPSPNGPSPHIPTMELRTSFSHKKDSHWIALTTPSASKKPKYIRWFSKASFYLTGTHSSEDVLELVHGLSSEIREPVPEFQRPSSRSGRRQLGSVWMRFEIEILNVAVLMAWRETVHANPGEKLVNSFIKIVAGEIEGTCICARKAN